MVIIEWIFIECGLNIIVDNMYLELLSCCYLLENISVKYQHFFIEIYNGNMIIIIIVTFYCLHTIYFIILFDRFISGWWFIDGSFNLLKHDIHLTVIKLNLLNNSSFNLKTVIVKV